MEREREPGARRPACRPPPFARRAALNRPCIDLHSHLAPAVDDGCRDLDETLRSLVRMRGQAVQEVVFTPHFSFQLSASDDDIRAGLARRHAATRLAAEAAAARADVPAVRAGVEFLALSEAHVRRLIEWPEIALEGTGYVLLEFGFGSLSQSEAVLAAALDSSKRILLAHPERYRFPEGGDALRQIRRWRDMGAALQVNLGSLLGDYDAWSPGAEALAWRMLEEGLAHVLASDDHGPCREQSYHLHVHALLQDRGGGEQAELLLSENPARILRGDVPVDVPGIAD